MEEKEEKKLNVRGGHWEESAYLWSVDPNFPCQAGKKSDKKTNEHEPLGRN
jgi:hypothetical protein